MGAGPSISELYINAGSWFKINMDKETYNSAFEQLDKDKDGGIGFQEFIGWVKERSAKYPDSYWQTLEASGMVMMIAHKQAALHIDTGSSVAARKTVDITELRTLFVHLYVCSMVYCHFAFADGKKERSPDMFRKKLDVDDFCRGLSSLCEMHGKDVELTREDQTDIFEILDFNLTGSVGFVQVIENL